MVKSFCDGSVCSMSETRACKALSYLLHYFLTGRSVSGPMNKQTETTITVLAAFFVLLSAMFDVRITLILAIVFLVALTIYHSIQAGKQHGNSDEI